MKAIPIGLVLLAVGVGGGNGQTAAAPAQEKTGAAPRWEYRVLSKQRIIDLGKKDLAAGLNALGDEGWELVVVDSTYIFKRPKDTERQRVAEVKQRIAAIESEVELWKERVAWSERMARRGFLSNQRVNTERARLREAEMALDEARRELQTSPPERKE
jgi:hypothetical protein